MTQPTVHLPSCGIQLSSLVQLILTSQQRVLLDPFVTVPMLNLARFGGPSG